MSNATDHPATDTAEGAPNQVAIFHVHAIPDLWGPALLGSVGEPLRNGVLVYRARPPIAGGEVEIEARGTRETVIVATRAGGATSPS